MIPGLGTLSAERSKSGEFRMAEILWNWEDWRVSLARIFGVAIEILEW